MCGIVQHLGALSWMSRLIPVPFDFLSAAAAGLWGREKTGFEWNTAPLEQAAARTRPPPQYLALLLLFCRLSFCEPSEIMVDSWWSTVS